MFFLNLLVVLIIKSKLIDINYTCEISRHFMMELSEGVEVEISKFEIIEIRHNDNISIDVYIVFTRFHYVIVVFNI